MATCEITGVLSANMEGFLQLNSALSWLTCSPQKRFLVVLPNLSWSVFQDPSTRCSPVGKRCYIASAPNKSWCCHGLSSTNAQASGRRLANDAQRSVVDELVKDLFKKMSQGCVLWRNVCQSFERFLWNQFIGPVSKGKHDHHRAAGVADWETKP